MFFLHTNGMVYFHMLNMDVLLDMIFFLMISL